MDNRGFTASGLAQLHDFMQESTASGSLPGAVTLLSRDGQIEIDAIGVRDLETGAPMTPDTIFRIASMTKAVFAAAAMMLVEDGILDLDAPVDAWLPELANRRVVRSVTGPLEDTVPAVRPITARHLLTVQFGLGALMMTEGESPLQDAMDAAGIAPGAFQPELTPDAWMQAIGSLPLAHQPGEGWVYHTGFDVLAVLLARVAEMPLGTLLQERIFAPLGMVDTGFFAPESSIDRLATAYGPGDAGIAMIDPARGGAWSREPQFPSELVSTASDYLAFAQMLLNNGEGPDGRLLSADSVREMTRDHIAPETKAAYPFFPGFWENTGWGYGVSVVTDAPASSPGPAVGSYGWSGGFHTHWQTDPANNLIGLLLMQTMMGGPDDSATVERFWSLAYNALDN